MVHETILAVKEMEDQAEVILEEAEQESGQIVEKAKADAKLLLEQMESDTRAQKQSEIQRLHLDGEEQLAREEVAVQQEIRELEKTAESRMQGAVELILENLA